MRIIIMKNGKCLKCNSNNIHIVSNYPDNTIPVSTLRVAMLDKYICINCGYIEQYLTNDKKQLNKIKEKYPKIN
jgi:hypothetical protein